MTLTAEQEDVKLTDDLAPYERERFHQARAVGFTRLEAARFTYGTGTLSMRLPISSGASAMTRSVAKCGLFVVGLA